MKRKKADFIKQIPYSNAYLILLAICGVLFLFTLYLFGSKALSDIFFYDWKDTGNDFFNCIPAVKDYDRGYGIVAFYPALARLCFLFAAHILTVGKTELPEGVVLSEEQIDLSKAAANSLGDLRMTQGALFIFLVSLVIISIACIYAASYIFKNESGGYLKGSLVIGTYSVLFTIERGNIIYIAFMFLLFFVVFYRSENRALRELSYAALALSAGIKLYPALFGILLLYDRRWKDALKTCIYGLIAIFLPEILFKNYFPKTESPGFFVSLWEWAKGLFKNMTNIFSSQIFSTLFFAALGLVLLSCVILLIYIKEEWKRLFLAGVMVLICGIQFEFPYSWTFLIPSFLYFLKEETEKTGKNIVYFVFMCFFHLPIPIIGNPVVKNLSYVGFLKMCSLFTFIIVFLILEIVELGAEKKKANIPVKKENVMILGGTGYLGSLLIKALVKREYNVLCIKRESSDMKYLEDVKASIRVCNIDELDAYLSESDRSYRVFINTAGIYPLREKTEEDLISANMYAPLTVFLCALNHGVEKFYTVGTGLPEDFNTYSQSKSMFADWGKYYSKRYQKLGKKFKFCNVKLETFYGRDEPTSHFIPGVIEKLKRNENIPLTEGDQKRDFIFVDDAVSAIIELVECEKLPRYIDFPIGTGMGTSIKQAVTFLKEITGSQSKLEFGAVPKRPFEPDSVADTEKMRYYGIGKNLHKWKEGLREIVKEEK